MSRRSRIWWRVFAAIAAVAVLGAAVAVLIARSAWFHEKVRLRIVAEAERATGGKVRLGAFRFHWAALEATLEDFAIRGLEPPDHAPLFRAQSVVVGLKIVSFVRRDVDIALLAVRRPEISIEVDADGRTNLPRPARPRATADLIEPLLKLAIGRIELSDGLLRYRSETIPLDLSAENFKLEAFYQDLPPRYQGRLAMDRFALRSPVVLPVSLDSDLSWTLDQAGLRLVQARLRSGGSSAAVSGLIETFDPFRATFDVETELALTELARPLGLPLAAEGRLQARARASLAPGRYSVAGHLQGAGLAFQRDRFRVRGLAAAADFAAEPGWIRLADLQAGAFGGKFRGRAELRLPGAFQLEGAVASLALDRILSSAGVEKIPWNGAISGPVTLRGTLARGGPPDIIAQARLALQPLPGEHPVEGAVEVAYNHRARSVSFGNSWVRTPATRLDFAGALGRAVRVTAASTDLDDLAPVAALFTGEPVAPLPVRLTGGEARFDGTVSGALSSPQVSGKLATGPVRYSRWQIDGMAVNVHLQSDAFRLTGLTVRRQRSRLEGDAAIGLSRYRPGADSPVWASLSLAGVALEEVAAEAGLSLPVSGVVSAAAKLNGTVTQPHWLARLHVSRPEAYGEKFDRLEAELRYSRGLLEVTSGRLVANAGLLGFEGRYRHAPEEWRRGRIEFDSRGASFRLARFQAVREFREGLDGLLDWRFEGTVELGGARPRLTALAGEARLQELSLGKSRLGTLKLEARSHSDVLFVSGAAELKAASVAARAEWSLAGESFGLGEIRFADLALAALHDVGLLGDPSRPLPVDGVLDGEIAFSGPVLRPATWTGMAKITRLELKPKAKLELKKPRDLTLRNAGPLVFAIDRAGIAIQQARLVAADTNLSAAGTLSFPKRNPWNLAISGSLDLSLLSAFEPELLAEGRSEIEATIRGSLLEPQVQGHVRFQNASFFLKDFPNGLEQVSGSILFDRSRATIEQLTAQTGGGSLSVGGFVGFGGEELVYRLQAEARRVRVRYPADVSTVLDARLEFTGTSTRSLLSGEVSVLRAAFHAGTDIGGLLSETARAPARPSLTSPFLRGMAFDIGIVTAGEAEFSTSLTKDIELEANLRLRGGPARPVLLGRVAVNQGEIIFFGNRYTIVQGEVTFFNPAKIEPVLAMDLETKVRGYTVTINFSGPLDQLNFSYRSDPPLQSQEILALLTVGRPPEATRAPGAQTAPGQSFLQAGGNTLLGQALATPVSSRLQRFFGVSRIKIDPQLTGVDNTPETYITIEQQVSREITLTYVTNLARTQQQIVRLEWNFSREWSVNAVRDSNGVFGVDFVYRRRF
jgi:translocation and assembly module TamB